MTNQEKSTPQSSHQVPEKKQTSLGLYVTAQEAYEMWKANPGTVNIVDVRTPRILLILRNAYGGAYASYNNYPTGADLVLALPTTRLAVMGPAGKEFVYKDDLRKMRAAAADMVKKGTAERVACGSDGSVARKDAEKDAADWLKAQEAALNLRYEKELMNPKEGLALGSISSIVMPTDLRKVLGENMAFLLRHYKAGPMGGPQREFY